MRSPSFHSGPSAAARRSAWLLVVLILATSVLGVFAAPGEPALAQSSEDPSALRSSDDGSSTGGATTPERTTPTGTATEESSEEASEEGGILGGIKDAVGRGVGSFYGRIGREVFTAILQWIYDEAIVTGLEEVGDNLAKSAFGLPAPEGEILSRYDQLVDVVKPGILVGILLLGVTMMLQGANYNVAYTTQHGLPKLVFAAAALVFFPEFMRMISDVSSGIAKGFIGEAEISGAVTELLASGLRSGGPLSVFMVIGQVAMLGIGALVVAVAILKNIAFSILFIAGPVALILYPIPGLSGATGAWFRGIVACAAIPMLYSLELTVGSWIVRAPELVFGSAGEIPIFNVLAGVVLLWLMWKTPFKVMGWAFGSYGAGGGFASSVARGVAVSTISRGLATAAGAFVGSAAGPAGAAAGAKVGGAAGGTASSAGSTAVAGAVSRGALAGGRPAAGALTSGGASSGPSAPGAIGGPPSKGLPPSSSPSSGRMLPASYAPTGGGQRALPAPQRATDTGSSVPAKAGIVGSPPGREAGEGSESSRSRPANADPSPAASFGDAGREEDRLPNRRTG
jgi:hypothetical protein